MEPLRDDQLIAELRALRPTPRPDFAAELDERAAAGFPRRPGQRRHFAPLSAFFGRVRAASPRRLLLPAAGFALAAIAASTVLVATSGGGSKSAAPSGGGGSVLSLTVPNDSSAGAPSVRGAPAEKAAPSAGAASAKAAEESTLEPESTALGRHAGVARSPEAFGTSLSHRDVERSAEITLGAAPADVADDTAKVFEAVHAHRGIVMRSSTSQGKAGEAGARFELLIPSRELGDAMAAFSGIDAVRSRHEATADITAPTVSAAELLKESRARIEGLLGQLGEAETETEREAVEAQLRHERRRASRLTAQLEQLHRRADYSRVLLRIETGGPDEGAGGGSWGFGDALRDAGHILTVAAAVTLIALAVLGPIALIALLAWLTHRAWVRRERRRALG